MTSDQRPKIEIASFARALEQLESFKADDSLTGLHALYDRLGLDEQMRLYLHGVVTDGTPDDERFGVFMLGLTTGLLALETEGEPHDG